MKRIVVVGIIMSIATNTLTAASSIAIIHRRFKFDRLFPTNTARIDVNQRIIDGSLERGIGRFKQRIEFLFQRFCD